MDGFTLNMNPQPVGNRNGWLIEDNDEEVKEDREDDEEIKMDEEDEEDREESPIYTAYASRADDPYVMVRDAVMAAREDDDDDITAPKDPQPSEPRGSPCDSQ
ncbi:hypothetical protein Tco_0764799 [Tanacetum coccineum]